ncbi:protein stum isoform X2 [Cylas formicarius]|uniref:protein stum isoform X2 n=1 Tax=Cylas formicarius TaxID=197179 RepID=UPI002958A526|nr:protein stum isoform X2 [Cylas formicarius]
MTLIRISVIDKYKCLPPAQHQTPPDEPVSKDEPPPNACKRFLGACTEKLSCRKLATRTPRVEEDAAGCFACLKKKTAEPDQVRINVEQEDEEGEKKKLWDRLKCCKKNRVADMQSCLPIGKRKGSWLERSESLAETAEAESAKCCSKTMCKKFFRALFCVNVCLGCAALCGRKKTEELPISRKASMISSKKKSLTPTTLPPPEDTTPKIDASLVEHTSHMKAAIPILPVWLAWFCCVMNCIAPGTGTILSGFFCLCIGKPRFSQKDGPKPRIGAFLIDLIIGFSQCFTVLFCLVGWGWSIWWGVIMVKIARRHKKLKQMENLEENASRPTPNPNLTRDADRRV